MTNFDVPSVLRGHHWALHRFMADRLRLAGPFSPGPQRRVLLITHRNPISSAQIFPYYFFRRDLAVQYGVQIREVTLGAFMQGRCPWVERADVVMLQTWFNVLPDEMARVLDRIHERCRPERLVFLDSFSPTDLRLAASVGPHVDLYVKKHLMRDRSFYGKTTYGHTNLMEYCGKRFELEMEPTLYPIPDGFLDRLRVGPSFSTAPYMLRRFLSNRPHAEPKRIDLHARFATRGSDWYSAMRHEAVDAVAALGGLNVTSGVDVPRNAYMRELASSRMCFSPFGYGEVCWRDYESIMCGALLIKPDMAHVETDPDIFVADETYVPVAWDLSDFADKVHHYAAQHAEREAICARAFERLHRYFASGRCVAEMGHVLTGEEN
jgi:hypothetical protein